MFWRKELNIGPFKISNDILNKYDSQITAKLFCIIDPSPQPHPKSRLRKYLPTYKSITTFWIGLWSSCETFYDKKIIFTLKKKKAAAADVAK